MPRPVEYVDVKVTSFGTLSKEGVLSVPGLKYDAVIADPSEFKKLLQNFYTSLGDAGLMKTE